MLSGDICNTAICEEGKSAKPTYSISAADYWEMKRIIVLSVIAHSRCPAVNETVEFLSYEEAYVFSSEARQQVPVFTFFSFIDGKLSKRCAPRHITTWEDVQCWRKKLSCGLLVFLGIFSTSGALILLDLIGEHFFRLSWVMNKRTRAPSIFHH